MPAATASNAAVRHLSTRDHIEAKVVSKPQVFRSAHKKAFPQPVDAVAAALNTTAATAAPSSNNSPAAAAAVVDATDASRGRKKKVPGHALTSAANGGTIFAAGSADAVTTDGPVAHEHQQHVGRRHAPVTDRGAAGGRRQGVGVGAVLNGSAPNEDPAHGRKHCAPRAVSGALFRDPNADDVSGFIDQTPFFYGSRGSGGVAQGPDQPATRRVRRPTDNSAAGRRSSVFDQTPASVSSGRYQRKEVAAKPFATANAATGEEEDPLAKSRRHVRPTSKGTAEKAKPTLRGVLAADETVIKERDFAYRPPWGVEAGSVASNAQKAFEQQQNEKLKEQRQRPTSPFRGRAHFGHHAANVDHLKMDQNGDFANAVSNTNFNGQYKGKAQLGSSTNGVYTKATAARLQQSGNAAATTTNGGAPVKLAASATVANNGGGGAPDRRPEWMRTPRMHKGPVHTTKGSMRHATAGSGSTAPWASHD